MKKVTRLTLRELQNLELYQLMADVLKYLSAQDRERLLIDTEVARLATHQQAYDEVLLQDTRVGDPQALATARADRKKGISYLYNGIRFYARGYPIGAQREAALRLMEIVKRHGGVKISQMPQALQSGTLTNLLQELAEEQAQADASLLGFTDLVTLIAAANYRFVADKQLRDHQTALLTRGKTRQARSLVEASFATLCRRINALAIIDGEDKYGDIIDTINHTVKLHIDTALRRTEASRNKKGKTSEATSAHSHNRSENNPTAPNRSPSRPIPAPDNYKTESSGTQ